MGEYYAGNKREGLRLSRKDNYRALFLLLYHYGDAAASDNGVFCWASFGKIYKSADNCRNGRICGNICISDSLCQTSENKVLSFGSALFFPFT